jgi:hypothetical protein
MTDADALELIYDEYVADERAKHGTKYEILAAIVFKALLGDHRVVHDLRLRGEGKEMRHQIDVTVERTDGKRLRLIIECRHLFASSRRATIDLDAVRSFASVVRALDPDQGMMLTTVGYTRDARTYAQEEGIVLGVLREFREEDWEGRVQEVHLRFDMSVPPPPTVSWIARDDEDPERLSELLERERTAKGGSTSTWTAVTYFYDADGNVQETLYDVLDPYFRRVQREQRGAESGRELFDAARWVLIGGELVAVVGFEWALVGEDATATHEFVVGLGDRVARLLLQTIDGELDHVFFDRDLLAFELAADGEVVPRRD